MDHARIGGLHRQSYRPDVEGPLAGVRVLDLSRLVAGNMVTHVLADFGAEVIKVEDPKRGDDLRHWRVEGVPTFWKVYARNKRSLALDYRSAEGLALLRRLVGTAQVLVENFVPGKLERIGLAPAELLALQPGLVVARISGWGQTGPFKHKPGFGSLVEAMSGFASMNGFPDREPVLPPLALADMITGLYGSTSIMVALRHAERTGAGQVLDLSLFEPMLSVLGPEAANYALSGRVTPRLGNRSAISAPRSVYACSDGQFVAMSASMQSMAERLFRVIGREDLITDPRFLTNADRIRNNDVLDPIIADFMRQRTRAENLALFDAAGVTVGPVCDAADLAQEEYVIERESIVVLPDEEIGELPMHNVVGRLSGTPGAIRSPAPGLGEHTDEILAGLGVDADGLATLRQAGLVA
jgi:crotonobetainyl-CoA:carnitine CoA-transferase CaiB-like acyl-CoA transferase